MAFTFLKALGYNVGTSLVDTENILFAKDMLDKYSKKIVLPVDTKATLEFSDTSNNRIIDITDFNDNEIVIKKSCGGKKKKYIDLGSLK